MSLKYCCITMLRNIFVCGVMMACSLTVLPLFFAEYTLDYFRCLCCRNTLQTVDALTEQKICVQCFGFTSFFVVVVFLSTFYVQLVACDIQNRIQGKIIVRK